MGVPAFFAWWANNFRDLILTTDFRERLHHEDQGCKVKLYLDYNGAIHPAVRTDDQMAYEAMNQAVVEYLIKIIAYVKPDEVYIAVDGVAPKAKMAQQRDRRYKSCKEASKTRDICIRHKQPVRDQKIDFNMISPGTEFMWDLQLYIEECINKRISKGESWEGITFTLNGSGIPGEGEHKIMADIRACEQSDEPDTIKIIYGLDADLMFLTLINEPNAFLMRENVQFRSRKHSNFYDEDSYPYVYLDVQGLEQLVTNFMSPTSDVNYLIKNKFKVDLIRSDDIVPLCKNTRWYTAEIAKTGEKSVRHRLILDYTYICFFLGNDFLPHLPALQIRHGVLNDLIVIYKKVAWMVGGFLVTADGKGVNRRFLREFLAELAYIEDELLIRQSNERERSIAIFTRRLKEMDPIQRDISRLQYIEDRYQDTIRAGQRGWQVRWYDYHHHIRFHNKKEHNKRIHLICQDFLDTTMWVLHYYQGLHENWSHLYSHTAAPTAQDLSDMFSDLDTDITFEKDQPVKPFVQLMSILPPDSAHLLPPSLGWYMTNRSSHIHHMYPLQVKLSLHGNRFLHECKAKLPHIDQDILTNISESHQEDLTEAELLRNQQHEIKTFKAHTSS